MRHLVINRGGLVPLKETISGPTKCIRAEKRIPATYWWSPETRQPHLVRMVSTSRATLSPFPGKDQNDLVCLVDGQLGHQVLQLVDQDGGALDHHNHHPHQQEHHGNHPGHQVLQLVDQEGRGQCGHPSMWDGDQLPGGDGDDIGPCNFWKSPNIKAHLHIGQRKPSVRASVATIRERHCGKKVISIIIIVGLQLSRFSRTTTTRTHQHYYYCRSTTPEQILKNYK